MKKFLVALIALAFFQAANASTVLWTVDAKAFPTSDGASERAADYFVTVFLYSDYEAVTTALSTLGSSPATAVETITGLAKSTGTTAKTGKATGSFTSSEPSITTVQIFSIAWDAKTIQAAEHYNLSAAVDSDAYAAPDNPTNTGTFTSSSYSGGWKAVPEPSTAMLALAGLALLIKRRRA